MEANPSVVPPAAAVTRTPALEQAVELTRKGDVDQARAVLGIAKDAVDDETFVGGMIALESAAKLVAQARQPEAVPLFQQAAAVVRHSTDSDSKLLVALLGNQAEGVARLIAGDAVGAHRLLDLGTDALARLSFFDRSLERTVLYYKAASLVAYAQTFLPVGDVAQMTRCMGKANDVYNQLLALLDPASKEDQLVIAEVFTTRLEVAIALARFDFEALDVEGMQRRLSAAKPLYDRVREILPQIHHPVLVPIIELSCTLYLALENVGKVAAASLSARTPLSKSQILQLQKVRDAMYAATSSAEAAGDRGARYLYTIRQLTRITENLLKMGTVTNRDLGRLAGIVSLGALVVLIVLVHATFHPEGWMAFAYFFGIVVVALIVGFGYGALRFKPLLSLVSEVLKSSRGEQSASHGGSEGDANQ